MLFYIFAAWGSIHKPLNNPFLKELAVRRSSAVAEASLRAGLRQYNKQGFINQNLFVIMCICSANCKRSQSELVSLSLSTGH